MTAVVVDSSGWVEFLWGEPNCGPFLEAMRRADPLVIPAVCIYEVYKATLTRVDLETANDAVVIMREHAFVQPLDESLAIAAARLSAQSGLAMADAMIFETALRHRAELWTLDADFEGMPGVHYVAPAPADPHTSDLKRQESRAEREMGI